MPDDPAPAALVEILHLDGRLVGSWGRVSNRGGRYISWLASRVALGRTGDTLLVLSLPDAILFHFAYTSPVQTASAGEAVRLPRYFHVTHAIGEEIRLLPWIRYGGELSKFVDAPQLTAATFRSDGTFFVIRNYSLEWRNAREPLFTIQGNWYPHSQGIEAYSPNGTLLGAYQLPMPNVQWLRVDDVGRLFVGGTGGHLVIAQDPTMPKTVCRALPSSLEIDTRPAVQINGSDRGTGRLRAIRP